MHETIRKAHPTGICCKGELFHGVRWVGCPNSTATNPINPTPLKTISSRCKTLVPLPRRQQCKGTHHTNNQCVIAPECMTLKTKTTQDGFRARWFRASSCTICNRVQRPGEMRWGETGWYMRCLGIFKRDCWPQNGIPVVSVHSDFAALKFSGQATSSLGHLFSDGIFDL